MPTTYAIPDGRVAMAATTYTGNSSTQSIANAVNGVGFQPDFVWIKKRSGVESHNIFDVVRGSPSNFKTLQTNTTGAEITPGITMLSALDSNGFTLGSNGGVNESGFTFVGWQWKANGAAVTNTAGSITSQVSANTAARFSVVTYAGNTTSGATVGHGLGVKPDMIIFKTRNGATDWHTYHSALPNSANALLYLNTTATPGVTSAFLNGTQPTSSIITLGDSAGTNGSSMVAYCFAAVPGYSAFGTWQNNNSTDGTFVNLGFRPKFLLLKNYDNVERWFTWDSTRQTYNMQPPSSNWLVPNDSAAEGANGATTAEIDGLSNGFKIRTTNPATGEISFGTRNYIYAAFAENPFKYANAR